MSSELRRVCSQLTFCPPAGLLRQTVVEQDRTTGLITDLFPLGKQAFEPAHTLFADGVLSAGIVSLKRHCPAACIDIHHRYHYLDFTAPHAFQPHESHTLPLLIDFGTDELAEINHLLAIHTTLLASFPLEDILAACTARPAHEAGLPPSLTPGHPAHLILWQGADLTANRTTGRTRVRAINE